ncbi:MAG: RNA-binding S4 domain-containing protein [Elainella sp.]
MGDEETATIKLDQFLKWVGAAQTGGEAKLLIQDGHVQVNGELELRRGRKLVAGDRVVVLGQPYVVEGLGAG